MFFSQFESLTTNTSYFSISDPKGKVVTRYSREMTLINGDGCDLTKKKVSYLLNNKNLTIDSLKGLKRPFPELGN